MCNRASTCPATTLPAGAPRRPASPDPCGSDCPERRPAAGAAGTLPGSFRALSAHPRPCLSPPRALPRGSPRELHCLRRGGDVPDPDGGPGMGPQAVQAAAGAATLVAASRPMESGEEKQLRGILKTINRPPLKAGGSRAPSAGPCFALLSRAAGMAGVQVQVPRCPRCSPPRPSLPPGKFISEVRAG